MSRNRRDKLFTEIKENPKNVSFEKLKSLYEMFGFEVKPPRSGGSHYKAILNKYTLTVPRPHGKHVKSTYVKEAIKIFEDIKYDEEVADAEKS